MSVLPGPLSAAAEPPAMLSISIVIPVWQDSSSLAECLRAISTSSRLPCEVIVVDDGSSEPEASLIGAVCHSTCARHVALSRNGGPAAARNAGARLATGDVILFLDADVTVHPDTLHRIERRLASQPEVAAIFGSYDDQPAAPGAVSRFRNLLHHYVHHQSAGVATTFWAGCGAIRRTVFEATGGYDESYRTASIEDVELGARLHASGYLLQLDPEIQVRHLKRWTLAGMFRVDLGKRAIPWTELNLRQRGLPTGLNFAWYKQASVLLVATATVLLAARMPHYAAVLLALTLLLNWQIYRFTAKYLRVAELPAAMGAHLLHYLASALGSPLGMLSYMWKRDRWGVTLFGLMLAAVLAIQAGSGAWKADFIAHPDEPAHFVTGIMVGEYFANPTANPIQFAKQYYLQYPKIGIGHWPPLQYFIHGVWMRIAGPSRLAALLLLALYAAAAAALIYELLWQDTGRFLASGAAIGWLANPETQRCYSTTLLDMPGTAFSLAALLTLRAWFNRPGPGAALLFGVAASCAMMMKQTALALALVPLLAIIVARRGDLIRRRDLWLMALPPLLLAAPWYLWQARTFCQDLAVRAGTGGLSEGPNHFMLFSMGALPLSAAALVGLLWIVRNPPVAWSLWSAVLLGTFGFGYVFRVSLIEGRYLLFAFAALIALATLAAVKLPRWTRGFAAALIIAGGAVGWTTPPETQLTDATRRMASGPSGHVVLSGVFDGAIIAAAAAQNPEPSAHRYWLRASKLFANVTWGGEVRQVYITDTQRQQEVLRRYGVNQVLEIRTLGGKAPAWQEQLRASLESETVMEAAAWEVETLPAPPEHAIRWYRRRTPVAASGTISFPLSRLGNTISDAAAEP